MATITLSEEKFNKVMNDVETLIGDVVDLLDQDSIVKKRITDIKANSSIGKSEEDLDSYILERKNQLNICS